MTSSLRAAPRAAATYLRLGTRNSALARVGAALVAGALRDAGAVVDGGCRAPIGALASVIGDSISLVAARVGPDGDARRDVARVGSRWAANRVALEAAAALAR